MTLYRILLFVHVLAAAAWAGGALFGLAHGLSVRASKDPARMAAYGREMGEFGGKYFAPTALVTFLAGVWLVIEGDWGWDQFWINSGLAVWLYSLISNVTWLAKLTNRIGELGAERGPTDPEVRSLAQQMFQWRMLEVALLVYAIFAMTYKPFA